MAEHLDELDAIGRSFVLLLNDLHALEVESSQEDIAKAERHARFADAIEVIRDRVWALIEQNDEQ